VPKRVVLDALPVAALPAAHPLIELVPDAPAVLRPQLALCVRMQPPSCRLLTLTLSPTPSARARAAAGLMSAFWPGLPTVLAYNAADLAVSALVVCPGIDAWLDQRPGSPAKKPLLRVVVLLVLGSAAMAVTVLSIEPARR